MYYRAQLSKRGATISSDYKDEQQLAAELKDMLNHGVTNPNIYQSINDLEYLDRYLSIRSEVGMSNRVIYYYGIRTGLNKKNLKLDNIINQINRITPVFKKNGVEVLYIYGIDEAEGSLLSSQRQLWSELRKKGIKIFVAGYKKTFELIGDQLDLLVFAGAPDITEADKLHSVGHKIYSYNNPQVGAENPYIYRKNYGLEIWRAGFDGVMTYAYQASFRSIWNDFDHLRFRDHNFVYPTVNGVIGTIAWEGFREAVDDVRYITTLEKAINDSKNIGEESARLINEAKRYLKNLKMTGVDDLNKMRDEVSRFIDVIGVTCDK